MKPRYRGSVPGNDMRRRIIEYWNEALLSSPESSTSHADPDLAYLDNAVENQVLQELLSVQAVKSGDCMDVGAGYGRFTHLFRRYYSRVVLLEPAERIYRELTRLWQEDSRVECHNLDLESYTDSRDFDLIFTSGVLYLYDDQMLSSFAQKAISMLKGSGILVVRDFVSVPDHQVRESSYVKDGRCYYRPPQFWSSVADRLGLELIEIQRSKPSLSWLRSRHSLRLLRLLGLKQVCRSRLAISGATRLGDFRLHSRGIHTVFIVMRLL